MLHVLFAALFATAAGQPQDAVPQPAPVTEAAPAPITPETTPTEAPAVEPRRVCRREAVTGSVLSQRVCRSVYQADLERDIGNQIMDHIQGVAVERPKP